MINLLFKIFNKDYSPVKVIEGPIINDCIFPIALQKYPNNVKGNFYVRKKKYKMGYLNPFFKDFYRVNYSGLAHLVITDSNGNIEEIDLVLIPNYFSSDDEFLRSAL